MEHILSLSYGKDSLACLGAIEELGWPLDRIVHAEVWATDTIHADLPPMVEFKAKADEIIKARWGIEVEHICAMKDGERLTYEKMELLCGGSLAVILFTNEMKEQNGISDEDISDIVNCIRSIEGVLVAVSIKQGSRDTDKYSISSRANCDIDVSAVCATFGGGGHKRASGASLIAKDPVSAFEACVPSFAEAVNQYKAR